MLLTLDDTKIDYTLSVTRMHQCNVLYEEFSLMVLLVCIMITLQ